MRGNVREQRRDGRGFCALDVPSRRRNCWTVPCSPRVPLTLPIPTTMSVKQNLTSESQLTPASLQGAVTHMNKDHVHNMTNIIQAHCNLSRPPTNVRMTAMDFEGFECTFDTTPSALWGKGSWSDSTGVRIPWTSGKISDAKGARVELVALSEQSDKKVGKVSRKQVRS